MSINVNYDRVAYAEPSARAGFIRRTYLHLALAVLAFIIIEALLLQWLGAAMIDRIMADEFTWFVVAGAFVGVSMLADSWARSDTSLQLQYLGLALYVVAEAVIFLPLLYIATYLSSPDVLPTAGMITAFLFCGLTFTAFTTRKDLSWLRGILSVGGFVALGIIATSIMFGFNLGVLIASVMVLLAAGAILYETFEVVHHYRTDQHVAAALALFASVATLFWYVLQLLAILGDDD